MNTFISTIFLFLFLNIAVFASETGKFHGLHLLSQGEYRVQLPSVSFSFTCSYVVLDVSSRNDLLRIATNFDCEDGEDQEFGAL